MGSRDGVTAPCPAPFRIEFPAALYQVTSRGDWRDPIFLDDEDRRALLAVVGLGLERFDA